MLTPRVRQRLRARSSVARCGGAPRAGMAWGAPAWAGMARGPGVGSPAWAGMARGPAWGAPAWAGAATSHRRNGTTKPMPGEGWRRRTSAHLRHHREDGGRDENGHAGEDEREKHDLLPGGLDSRERIGTSDSQRHTHDRGHTRTHDSALRHCLSSPSPLRT